MTRWFAPALLALAAAGPAAAQVPPDKTLATMKVADGLQVELFAHEPMVINPTNLDVDHKGRVWVTEAVNYRRKNFGRPILRPEGDRIQVLIDKNGDGKADEAVTFYQGPELYGPLSVCVIPQADGKALRVLVTQSPDILEFWDKDGDLKADGPPTKFLSGFRGFDHDHGVHGLNVGPDGKLYFTVGDSGVGGLQSKDGKGRKWETNTTDCRAGTVWRCDQDGTNLELVAHNFRNNYEACVDSFGEIWLSDNDDDGNQQTRICYVMPGGNYGYNPRGPGQTHWHEEQPGIVHKALRTGFGSPTGITFYEGTLFPEKYRGHLLHCDAGPREVRAFFRKPTGAGYELDKEVILTSSDSWFRPSGVRVAPDGSVFVCDWYDPGVGGHGMGDWTRGRVFRITPKGHSEYKVPEMKLDTPTGVVAALGSPCQATRAAAVAKLGSLRATAYHEVITAGLESGTPVIEARTFLSLASMLKTFPFEAMPPDAHAAFNKLIKARARSAPFGVMLTHAAFTEFGRPLNLDAFGPSERFPNELLIPWAREELLVARTHAVESVKNVFYPLAKLYDGQDIFYRAALNIACGTDPARRDAILADFATHFPEWNDRVADLVWELRPKSMLQNLPALVTSAKLTAPQKARVVDILAASDDPKAGESMLTILRMAEAPPEVKARAIEQLRLYLPTKWNALRTSGDLNADINVLLRNSPANALHLIAAAGSTQHVMDVIRIARAGDEQALELRVEAVRTLGKLKSAASVDALAGLTKAGPPVGPEAVTALGGLIGNNTKPDDAGTKALAALQGLVTAAPTELQKAAVGALAGTRPGTIWLLDLHTAKKLPAPVVAETGRLLRNSPFAGERNRAMLLFPAPGRLDLKNLPPMAELVARGGDAARGKALWDASFAGAAQCAKCHMVRGVGGQVGPDLSMIGKKASRENLFDSILDPSKAIADQYIQHQVVTTAGVTVTGLLVSDTPQAITLRDANGKDTAIPKADIDGEVRKSKTSLMPQDVVAALTADELVDLVSYLQTLQTAAYTPDTFRLAGPFPAANMTEAFGKEYGPEKGAFDPAAKFRANGKEVGWQTLRPDPKGYFDLAGFHGAAGVNSASYLYAEIDSPDAQDAQVLLGIDDSAVLWVNGREAFRHADTRAAAPGQHTVSVRLAKGKNTILLKVANGDNPHGAYFTLLTAAEVRAAR
ncbi:MAG TPA: PVC-type heme-binding CxxCH protein [Urbifossiella sp.]|jgi:putative membrane-bound dehydrogenase-like protein|nr:PVC-type heme-binding CxxCH protein [Urbifossiella sp.]